MATRIAEYLTQKLVTSSVIEEGDRELYNYGFFLLLIRSFFFFITVFTGFVASVPAESVLFYMVFISLRTYAGGGHAKTETTCTMLTTLALTVSVLVIKVMILTNSNIISMLMLIVGSFFVFVFSPLDSEDKPLTNEEKRHYRLICYCLASMYIVISNIAQYFSITMVHYSVACGVFLEGTLLIIGKLCISKA